MHSRPAAWGFPEVFTLFATVTDLGWLAAGLQLAARLSYVLVVGTILFREDRARWFTERYGLEPGYRRFQRIASTLMNLDAVLFVVVCVLTRGTLATPWPGVLRIAVGVIAIVVGASTKLWALGTLGSAGYHWRDFFDHRHTATPQQTGLYRYLKNPMYTVGYLHVYGLALVFDSAVAIGLAVIMHIAILLFYFIVERPHFAALTRSSVRPSAPPRPG